MEVRTTSAANRRAPIPRPWLSKKQQLSPDSPKTSNVDILEKPDWRISWNKLSSCFCIKEQSNERRHLDVPFPAFPAIRRNSSCSFSSCELYRSYGSVSSFTDSDTSSYSSVSTEQPKTAHISETPPPAPISKPPSVTNRSRSAGLPPLNPSSSMTTPQRPRNRCDTGDFTRTSATTNTSRHRRLEQFQFSTRSFEQIWKGSDEEAIPPSFVLCEGQPQIQGLEPHPRRDSGLISALDGTEDWEGYCGGDDDEDSHSPFAQLGRKIAEDRNIEKRGKTPKVSRQKRQTKSDKEKVTVHVYLRKSPTLDFITEGNLTLSGWLAVSFGNDSFETRLRKGSKIKVREMFYMRIVESNGLASILLHKSDGHLEHAFTLQRDWFCDSREISSRIGNCVTVRSRAATIVTLLPVSVDDSFFCSGELVSSTKFSSLQHQLFVGGKGKVYAPDEQHDAVMYIRFSLDALIKTCGQWKSTN